ncbi:MAG: hypothetical protein ABI831_11670 [Betaproteobacteria bacterium]
MLRLTLGLAAEVSALADTVLLESTTGGAIAIFDADASDFGAAVERAGADSERGALAEGIGTLDAGCGGTSTGAAAPEETGLTRADVVAPVLLGSTADGGWPDAVLATGCVPTGDGFGAGALPAAVFRGGVLTGGDTTVLAAADAAGFGAADGSGKGALLPVATVGNCCGLVGNGCALAGVPDAFKLGAGGVVPTAPAVEGTRSSDDAAVGLCAALLAASPAGGLVAALSEATGADGGSAVAAVLGASDDGTLEGSPPK